MAVCADDVLRLALHVLYELALQRALLITDTSPKGVGCGAATPNVGHPATVIIQQPTLTCPMVSMPILRAAASSNISSTTCTSA